MSGSDWNRYTNTLMELSASHLRFYLWLNELHNGDGISLSISSSLFISTQETRTIRSISRKGK